MQVALDNFPMLKDSSAERGVIFLCMRRARGNIQITKKENVKKKNIYY